MENYILISCPIRNREYSVNTFLQHIKDLIYPKNKLSLFFIINDSVDNTEKYLQEFKNEYKHLYKSIEIDKLNFNAPKDSRTSIRRKFIFKNLSILRNKILDKAIELNVDYLFMIDSDVYVSDLSLKKLLSQKKDIISATIDNSYGRNKYFNVMWLVNDRFIRLDLKDKPDVFKCDLTGACILISKKVLKSGCRYGFHPVGEDAAFCLDALSKGFELYSYKGIAFHDMRPMSFLNKRRIIHLEDKQ